jgi:hypothetical protein
MRSLATRRQHLATSAVLRDTIDLLPARGLRPGRGRDRRHRPERHRDRRPRRPADLRDDLRVRRAQPAREDRHARLRRWSCSTSSRSAAPRTRCATCASSGGATIRSRQAGGRTAGVPDDRQPVQRPGVNRLFAAICRGSTRCRAGRRAGPCRTPGRRGRRAAGRADSRGARPLPRRDRRRGSRREVGSRRARRCRAARAGPLRVAAGARDDALPGAARALPGVRADVARRCHAARAARGLPRALDEIGADGRR